MMQVSETCYYLWYDTALLMCKPFKEIKNQGVEGEVNLKLDSQKRTAISFHMTFLLSFFPH